MEKDELAYIMLIRDSFRKIEDYMHAMSFEEFSKEEKTQSAVLMQLHVVGELAKKVPEKIKKELNLPWKDMAGFRDMISHEYFNLDIKLIWETVTESVPNAYQEIKKYLDRI